MLGLDYRKWARQIIQAVFWQIWGLAIGAVITQLVMAAVLIITETTVSKTNPRVPLKYN